MDRSEILALIQKATIDTPSVTSGMLQSQQARAFLRKIRENNFFLSRMSQVEKDSDTGTVDRMSVGRRLIRAATENTDDGYRAGAAFDQIGYTAKKIRLPWEVTEDVFHGNIEGENFEQTLTEEMTTQFGDDLSDLSINGDTAAGAGADQAFLQIDDGILKLVATANVSGRRINGLAINTGHISPAHFFTARRAMPNKYIATGGLRWLCSPVQVVNWWEYLTNRTGAQGDALLGVPNDVVRGPLGIPFLAPPPDQDGVVIPGIPSWPDDRLVLADPKNFQSIVTWDVRKRRVTGETDMQLAALDKRFYVFFIKKDTIVQETDAVVDVFGLVP
jgi:hypothetical protein